MKETSDELEKLYSQQALLSKEWEQVMHATGYSGQIRREIVLANINTLKVEINKLELGEDYKLVYPQLDKTHQTDPFSPIENGPFCQSKVIPFGQSKLSPFRQSKVIP